MESGHTFILMARKNALRIIFEIEKMENLFYGMKMVRNKEKNHIKMVTNMVNGSTGLIMVG